MVQVIKSILKILEEMLAAIIELLFDCIKSLIKPEHKTEYDADFLDKGEVLSKSNHGFCLNGKEFLSIEDSFKNALIIGSTGAYKSSATLIPTLLKMHGNASIVVTDFNGELLEKTSGAILPGEILYTDWGNPTKSEGYNPLMHLTNNTSDILKLSKMAVTTVFGHNNKDPFWSLASESLISLMTKYIVNFTSKEYHTMYNVYHLVSALAHSPQKADKLFARTGDYELLAEYKAFIAYTDKVVASIVATSRAALSIFGTDPNVALTTSHDSIDFQSFRTSNKVLFVTTATKDMRYFSLITSLFLDQFFGAIMSSRPHENDRPIFFLIDEASSLYFSNLQIVIANIRKYRAGILQIYQSASQLIDLYGAPVAKAITENCYARVYMAGQPIQVAQELEATLGKFEYADENETRHIRPLLTADEIRKLDDSLIFCGNKAAIKTKVTPYFKQQKLKRLTELPPYVPVNKLPFSNPPLLPLD